MAKLKENSLVIAEMRKATYSQYLSDLTPSDFYLFDYVKQVIAGKSFSSAEELLLIIGAILDGIEDQH
jgi:hypothetical protein